MRCVFAVVLTFYQIVVKNDAVNYCGAKMCGHSNAHTFCQYRAGRSPACVGYIEAHLSKEEKINVLARLNRRRGDVARGLRHWPPAGDMVKLVRNLNSKRWIEDLSREAQQWADQCRPPRAPEEHDTCRDLYSISVGQCVASIVGEAPGLRPESMIDMWYMQNMVYNGNVTSYTPPIHTSFYGDFAQMIWSTTYMVGCARSIFMANWRGRLRSVQRLVCNFAPRGPVRNRLLWLPAEPASICPPRSKPDKDVPGLCTYQNYDDESKDFNDNLSDQNNYLLDTILEIEKNESLNYFGSLDELYLTKVAIATIENNVPTAPLYYSVQKGDVLEQTSEDIEWGNGNNSESNLSLNISTTQSESESTTIVNKRLYGSKNNLIGRPKPYDIDDLNDSTEESKDENPIDIQEFKVVKEKDLYVEYNFLETEDENINFSSTAIGFTQIINDNIISTIQMSTETMSELKKITNEMVGIEKYFNKSNEEMNETIINDKNVDDYFSDRKKYMISKNIKISYKTKERDKL